eukprot:scaffold153658_cov19-Tisochrysis_lutea.AAC.2
MGKWILVRSPAQGNASTGFEELAASLEGPACVPTLDGPRATLIICPPSVSTAASAGNGLDV